MIMCRQDQRKMDDFIIFALGAAAEAIEDSGWTLDATRMLPHRCNDRSESAGSKLLPESALL